MKTEIMQPPQLSLGRLLLLGVSSVILCMSFIMSVFAPFPLALAIILYGRSKGFLTGVVGLGLSYVFASVMYKDPTLVLFYFCVLAFGIAIGEIVLRKIPPIKGMVIFGLGFILTISAAVGAFVGQSGQSLEHLVLQEIEKSSDKLEEQKKILEQSTDRESIEVLQLLDRPDLIAKELVASFPGYFFMGVFMMLWFNMFLVLKSRRLLLSGHDYHYTERSLLNFKVPFGFVIVLALGLVLAIWGNEWLGSTWETVGFTIIRCLGIFYFFQGFGVFSDLLTFLGIMGFFRTLIVMIVIFMAHYLVVAAGLFDNWFDFRKYFIKRKTED
jgi:MFS family permease